MRIIPIDELNDPEWEKLLQQEKNVSDREHNDLETKKSNLDKEKISASCADSA